ncbi:MAG: NmrA family NAD(P)-binding protein [bacterium]
MKKVLVVGGNGHVGYTLTKLLFENGYRVRATMRGMDDAEKSAPLRELGVELAEADLMDVGAPRKAAEGR